MTRQVPSPGSALATIAMLTVQRLLRGRALWVCAAIACGRSHSIRIRWGWRSISLRIS